MPSRTRTYFPPFTMTRRIYNSGGSLTGTTVTSHPSPHGLYHPKEKVTALDWGRTVNYKTKRKTQGYLPTLSLTARRLQIEGSWITNVFRDPTNLARVELTNGVLRCPQSYDYVQNPTSYSSVVSATKLDAKYRALSRARDMRTNLPVLLGEMPQTVRMLTDTAKSLASAYRNFRKGKFKQAARALGIKDTDVLKSGFAANNWLAYQYGWRPLLSDAVGLATTLYDAFEGNGKWGRRFTVQSGRVKANTATGTGSGGANYSVSGWNDLWSWKREIVARAGLYLEVQNQVAAASAQLGVGLTDPLLTAWELTPFSFVFDWFVDVGGWIEARSSLQGLKVLTGYVTEEITFTGNTTMTYATGPYKRPDFPVSPWAWTTSYYWRTSWSGDVTELRTPIFDALNGDRLKSAASLFRQYFLLDRNINDPYPVSPSKPRKRAKKS